MLSGGLPKEYSVLFLQLSIPTGGGEDLSQILKGNAGLELAFWYSFFDLAVKISGYLQRITILSYSHNKGIIP